MRLPAHTGLQNDCLSGGEIGTFLCCGQLQQESIGQRQILGHAHFIVAGSGFEPLIYGL